MQNEIRVDDLDDLHDFALQVGASVESETGATFNAAQRSGIERVRSPRPAAQADLAQVLKPMLDAMVQAMQARPPIHLNLPPTAPGPAPVVQMQPARPVAWKFDFLRDKDGILQSIHASPKE